ncbi:MAG: polysaccharide deacetylase family protein [Acidobacteriota bacterium]
MTRVPTGSLSLDLDNLWSYLKVHGDPAWSGLPSYLDRLVPVVLERLAAHGLTITVFVVGQDAAEPRHHDVLARLAAAGHEIANHSFRHEPWLHLYSREELVDEIAAAEAAIEAATGRRPRGFRGPGFSLSPTLLEVLAERGYLYDASTLPTFIGPLARTYYLMRSRHLSAEERRRRAKLFGTLRDGLRPLRPYVWSTRCGRILEIPVTTMPLFRVPIHLSYLLYLSSFAPVLMRAYLALAVALLRLRRLGPSFLLHPLDFLGGDDVPELGFFPAMNLPTATKLARFDLVIGTLARSFRLLPMHAHADAALAAGRARPAVIPADA